MDKNWLYSLLIIGVVLATGVFLYWDKRNIGENERKIILARLGKYVCAMTFVLSISLLNVVLGKPSVHFSTGETLDIAGISILSVICFLVFVRIERRLRTPH